MPCDVTSVSITKRRPLVRFCHSVAPKTICCHISKGIFSCICKQKLWRRNGSVKILYMDGSFLAETSVTSPGVPCHINIHYENKYIYILCIYIHEYIYIYIYIIYTYMYIYKYIYMLCIYIYYIYL